MRTELRVVIIVVDKISFDKVPSTGQDNLRNIIHRNITLSLISGSFEIHKLLLSVRVGVVKPPHYYDCTYSYLLW